MKNIYSTIIMAFLICLMPFFTTDAVAQTWDFQEEGVSSTDRTNLSADTENWTYDATNDRYSNNKALNSETLKANGTELIFTQNIIFTAETSDAIRVDIKKQCLTLNKVSTITIDNLEKGSKITVKCKTSSKTEKRGLNVTNITPESGFFNSTSLDDQVNIGTVTEDGSITLTNTGGLYIYMISVEKEGEGTTPEPTTDHSVSLNSQNNQMRLTLTNNDIKYYNTDEVKVSIDRANGIVNVSPVNGTWTDAYTKTVKNISFAKAEDSGSEGDIDNPEGKVKILESKGWHESAFVKWEPFADASSYIVYVKGGQYEEYTKLDDQLVRNYGTYGRADATGLIAADNYSFKIVPVIEEKEQDDAANEVTGIKVINYKREGFCFLNGNTPGAYNADGTLKANARVIYVTANTAKTVTCPVIGDKEQTYTGLQAILNAYQKGKETRPLCVRIIGMIKDTDMDALLSNEGLQIKGKNNSVEMNITIEGIGEDATINGFGFLLRNAVNVELRNFGILNFMDDGVSLDTDNKYCWIHNLDLFYGQAGGDSDQAKGDGTIDIKGDSQYITVSSNHFFDSGKSSLCGMTSESGPNYISYNNNWFDHCDSRMPRIRTMSVHVWNNYFDGISKYGVGATSGSNVFVESNYFRATKCPMLISKQGSDISSDPKGTFSGEDGGMIKSFGNIMTEKTQYYKYVTYQEDNVQFDAYEAKTRDEQVPQDIKTLQGATSYNNFDTDASLMYDYEPVEAANVPSEVTGWYGAGRMNHGDFKWAFNNSIDDTDYNVNKELKEAVTNYKSSLIGIFGDENASSGETGGGETGGEPGDTETPVEGEIICDFTNGTPSNSAITMTGTKENYRKEDTIIDGVTYTNSLKMESGTEISFSTTEKMTLTIYFGSSSTKYNIKVDDVKIEGDSSSKSLTTTIEQGSHKITKADSCTVALIKLTPVGE